MIAYGAEFSNSAKNQAVWGLVVFFVSLRFTGPVGAIKLLFNRENLRVLNPPADILNSMSQDLIAWVAQMKLILALATVLFICSLGMLIYMIRYFKGCDRLLWIPQLLLTLILLVYAWHIRFEPIRL